MSEIDQAFRRAQDGDPGGFTEWVRRAELPLRASLRSFARAVDAEAIVQETLLRMWVLFTDCLETQETSPLEPDAIGYKFYAPSIGLIKDGTLKLISSSGLP